MTCPGQLRIRCGDVVYLAVLVTMCAAATGCLAVQTPTEAEARIFAAMIWPSDLPQGWREAGAEIEDVEDAEARVYSFQGPAGSERHSAVVTQHVTVYFSTKAAEEGYRVTETRWFPTAARVAPPQLPFDSAFADQFRFGCISATVNQIPLKSCTATGRYDDMVLVFHANVFEDRWFTWDDLEHVLQVVDERMAAQMQ